MSDYVQRVREAFGLNRLNLATLTIVVGLLVVSHLVIPHWSTRYGAYLAVFSIWMGWFVYRVADLLGDEGE